MTDAERVRALIGNIKNWSWDIYPKFFIEQEDAKALQNDEALKEYLADKERYK